MKPDHDELRRLAEAATSGVWAVLDRSIDDSDQWIYWVGPEGGSYEDTIAEIWDGEHDGAANAAFIAALNPDTIKLLLAENAALKEDAEQAKLQDILGGWLTMAEKYGDESLGGLMRRVEQAERERDALEKRVAELLSSK